MNIILQYLPIVACVVVGIYIWRGLDHLYNRVRYGNTTIIRGKMPPPPTATGIHELTYIKLSEQPESMQHRWDEYIDNTGGKFILGKHILIENELCIDYNDWMIFLEWP